MLQTLRSLPTYRPGIAYVIDTLYLAPSVRSHAANSTRSCRGPGFVDPLALPKSRDTSQQLLASTESGFEPLPPGAPAPTAEELACLVDEFYAAKSAGDLGSMGENDSGVVFQGDGDPLLTTDIVLKTVQLVAEKRNALCFRLNTLGLCDESDINLLLESDVVERIDQGDRRRDTRISCISVFLPASSSAKYDELLAPNSGRGFRDVCGFVARLAEAGVNVECTAVSRPDVNVPEIERLVLGLGARSFRKRSWIQ